MAAFLDSGCGFLEDAEYLLFQFRRTETLQTLPLALRDVHPWSPFKRLSKAAAKSSFDLTGR